MKESSVSPERCETNCRYPASRQIAIARSVSVTVPIWLSLISEALVMPRSMALVMMAGLVQKLSSPTSSTVCPRRAVRGDPALVVVLAEAVLDRVHREVRHDACQPLDQVGAAEQLTGDPVAAVRLAELRRRQVQGDGDSPGSVW